MKQHTEDDIRDEARLTAYALGELEGAERAEIEARLPSDAAARELVEGVRATARELEASFASEAAGGLTPEQRATVEKAAVTPVPATRGRVLRVRDWMALAVAAGVLGVFGVSILQRMDESAAPPETELAAALEARPQADGRAALRSLGYGGGDTETAASPAGPLSPGPVGAASRARLEALSSESRAPGERTAVDQLFEDGSDGANREAYEGIVENPFLLASEAPLSTFSIDVDTASFTNVRRMLVAGNLPPADAVRVEEFVNYFPYTYEPPAESEAPFAVHVEVGAAPWAPEHRLVRIGLKGRETVPEERRPANLVFLLDVSGSMNNPNKLPLLKRSMQMLVQHLGARDRVAVVVYAGASGLVLPSTSCEYPLEILQALENLKAGGSTNGGAGIELAYRVARDNFIEGGINRVILATDGDFNVGTTSDGALESLIAEKAKSGVFLSVLGFGMGNYQDAKLEKLSGRGNGHFAYIDSLLEAKKVLVEELGATLETIAKDVKIQVDFNPLEVKGYRLIGYENRLLAAQDFLDDKKDAGEIGAGHTVTALYEVVPAGGNLEVPGVEPSKYVDTPQPTGAAMTGEMLTVRLRFKRPDADVSEPLEVPVVDSGTNFFELSDDTRFAAAAAGFGLVLRGSAHVGTATLDDVRRWSIEALGEDTGGYREQMIKLIDRARELKPRVR